MVQEGDASAMGREEGEMRPQHPAPLHSRSTSNNAKARRHQFWSNMAAMSTSMIFPGLITDTISLQYTCSTKCLQEAATQTP
ncbi:unnamed protein product [Urochloa humidicola]